MLAPCNGDDPQRVHITTWSYRKDRIDLRHKFGKDTYTELKGSDEDEIWGGASGSSDRTACWNRYVGSAFEFKTTQAVHEVVIEMRGKDQDDWQKARGMYVTVGNQAGHNDARFGPTGFAKCQATQSWKDSGGWSTFRHSDLTRTGRFVSVIAKSDRCDCDNRRRRSLEAVNASGARRLGWSCGSLSCARTYLEDAYAFQYRCPGGTYPNDPQSFADGNCKSCEDGFWCPGGTLGRAASEYRKACPAGSVGRGTRKSSEADGCKTCDAGTILIGTSCSACSPGSFCPKDAASEQPCPAGFVCATPAEKTACPSGKYCPQSSTTAQDCPAKKLCTAATASPCPSGSYCPAGQNDATPCPEGSYCPAEASSPTACGPGTLCAAGSSGPAACTRGHFCNGGMATACPKGTFSASTSLGSAAQCTSCPAGTYGSAAGQESAASGCSSCESGSSSTARSVGCFPLLKSVEATDPGSVATGFTALDRLELTFHERPGRPSDVATQPDVGSGAASPHGVGVYAAVVFWSTDPDTGQVHCTSGDADVRAAVALAAGVSTGDIVVTALLGDGRTQIEAEWSQARPKTLRIEVKDPNGVDTRLIATDAGALHAFPAPGMFASAADAGSVHGLMTANQVVLTGTWGQATKPAIVSAVLRDTGRAEGMGVGDSIELQFNQEIAGRALSSVRSASGAMEGARSIIRLWPLGATAPLAGWEGTAQWGVRPDGNVDTRAESVGDLPRGYPAKNASVIVVNITAAPSWEGLSPANASRLLSGAIRVEVLGSADMRGIGEMAMLGPANNTVVTRGSWGEAPVTPIVRSHSATSATISWRPPHRPGTVKADGWSALGLDGFLVVWCDGGDLGTAPGKSTDEAASSYTFFSAAVQAARAALPHGTGDAGSLDALFAGDRCSASYQTMPRTEIELASELWLPLLPTDKVPLSGKRWFVAGVAAVFLDVVGQVVPAVDGSPTQAAAQSMGRGDEAAMPTDGTAPPLARCFEVDWAAGASAGAPPSPCLPWATLDVADRVACRCTAVVPGPASQPSHSLGRLAGSAMLRTEPLVLDGVHTASELGTAGGEFLTLIGDGMPISVPGLAVADRHDAAMRSRLAGPLAAAASLAPGLLGAHPSVARGSVLASTPGGQYIQVSYGGGWGGETYDVDETQCSVLVEGLALRCLSVEGVGAEHTANITVGGHAPIAPITALGRESGIAARPEASLAQLKANATIKYAAPYIQEFTVFDADSQAAANTPTRGGVVVELLGRHFGPLAHPHIDDVRFSPSRHGVYEYVAANCTVSRAHTVMRCTTPENAGARAYWTARIAGQESLLPSTSAARPTLTSIELVTAATLTGADDHVLLAVRRVLGAGNGTLNRTEVLAAFAALPGAESLDLLPTGGGPLILLHGSDLGPGAEFVAAVWAARQDGVRRDVFSQDVDAARESGVVPASPSCTMASPHASVLCQVPPGAGTGFSWYVQVLDQVSNGVPSTSYAPVELTGVSPAAFPSEGGTLTVTALNLPPVGDPFSLSLRFNGEPVLRFTRSQDRPLEEFTFEAPAVVVSRAVSAINGSEAEDGGVAVSLQVRAAEAASALDVPFKSPVIDRFGADSPLRNTTAAAVFPPPEAAGGASGAILLEVYGSSFGGDRSNIRLAIDDVPCLALTEAEIRQHLTLGRPDDPHREFFCWTPLRSGDPSLSDTASRSFLGSMRYDFDAINAAPRIISALLFNRTNNGPRAVLDTRGGDVISVQGASLSFVSRVEIALLEEGADTRSEVPAAMVKIASECALVPRGPAVQAGRPDPCPDQLVPSDGMPDWCVTEAEILCVAPPGVGSQLYVHAIIQSAAVAVHGWSQPGVASYSAPQLDAVAPSTALSAGGTLATVSGRFFGIDGLPRDGSTPGLDPVLVTIGGRPCAVQAVTDAAIDCLVPPGIEPVAELRVTVQGQQGVSAASGEPFLPFAYAPPSVLAADVFDLDAGGAPLAQPVPLNSDLRLHASTRGGWLRVSGTSLGSAPLVDFVSQQEGAAVLPCVADAAVRPAGSSSSHDVAWCRVAGSSGGIYDLRVRARMEGGTATGAEALRRYSFVFRPAAISAVYFDSLSPDSDAGGARDVSLIGRGRSPTSGGFLIHVVGQSFTDQARVLVGGSPCDVVAGTVDHSAPLSLGSVVAVGEGARGGAYAAVAVDASAMGATGSIAAASVRAPVTVTDRAGAVRAWLTHELVTCRVPAGTGEADIVVTSTGRNASAPALLTYDAPVVSTVAAPVVQAHLPGSAPPAVTIRGLNFGALAAEIGVDRRVLVNVTARGILPFDAGTAEVAPSPGRLLRGLAADAVRSAPVTPPVVLCALPLMQAPHEELVCSPAQRIPVGLLAVSVAVGGQASQERVVLALCPAGSYGGPGEHCRPCPEQAFCAGGFAEPQPLPGFFKRGPATFLECNPRDACPGAEAKGIAWQDFSSERLPVGRWQPGYLDAARPDPSLSLLVDVVTPADPAQAQGAAAGGAGTGAADPAVGPADVPTAGSWRPEAGAAELPVAAAFSPNGTLAELLGRYMAEARQLDSDQCIAGYVGERCAGCQDRFYRLEGRCEPCPELAWLMIPGFICALLALLGVGLFLQKKHVQLAGLSVGVDMLQILSIFAALDLNWPLEIRTVWTTVSMTTFSLQILAPECSIKVDYADKFFTVAAIPPVLALGCVALVVADVVRRAFFSKRAAKAHSSGAPSSLCPPACWAAAAARAKPSASPEAASSGLVVAAGSPRPLSDSKAAAGQQALASPASASKPGSGKPKPGKGRAKPRGAGGGFSHDSPMRKSIAATIARTVDIDKVVERQRRPKRDPSAAALDAGLGLALTLLYFVYLTATRNALQPLDCTTVDAADGTGLQSVMQLEPSVACDVDNDPTYSRVLPWAVITLLAYGLGIPALFAVVLLYNRRSIVADQTLLASGEGHSPETNPHFATRKRYGRLYADYKPEAYWWRLVLTMRKALVAVVSILFTKTPVFAASSTALVLFVSFLLHSRYQPFLQAPPVSKRFLALAGPEEEDGSTTAKGGKPGRGGKASKAAKPGSGRRGGCCFGVPSLPPGVVACLRNTSPVFAVCLTAASDGGSADVKTSQPSIDFGSVGSSATKGKRSKKAAGKAAKGLGRSASAGSLLSAAQSSAAGKADAGGAAPSPADRPADGAASESGASAPTKMMLEFAAAAAKALEAKAKEDAVEAARVARSSSLAFVFDYNTLEGSFLITGVLVLMGGLAFSSNAITPGSPAYYVVVAAIILLVGGAVLSFSWVLAFELYRALRFADVLTKARQYQDTVLARADDAKRAAAELATYRRLNQAPGSPGQGFVASRLRSIAKRTKRQTAGPGLRKKRSAKLLVRDKRNRQAAKPDGENGGAASWRSRISASRDSDLFGASQVRDARPNPLAEAAKGAAARTPDADK